MQDKNSKKVSPTAKKANGGSSKKNKKIILISAILLVVIALSTVLTVLLLRDDEFNFDPIVANLTYGGKDNEKYAKQIAEFISISPDIYKNYPISETLDEYKEIYLTRRINALLVQNKSDKPEYDGVGKISIPISIGDVVSIYYRGYTVDADGKETEFSGSSNYSDDTYFDLEIGSGSFIPGFEDALVGVVPSDYERFFKMESGAVRENYVVYISYFSTATGYGYEERVDLSDPDIDKTYGEGFRDYLLSAEIGVKQESKVFKLKEGLSAGYHDLTVQYATDCESNVLTIDVTFPTEYPDAEFRGVKAKFDVFIKNAVIYNVPEFNEEFITKTLGVKADDLKNYSGEGIVEKYKNLLREEIRANIEKSNNDLIVESMWAYYLAKAEIKSLPENEVSRYENSYYSRVENYYKDYTSYYSSLDECATDYLGLSVGADWRTYIRSEAERTVKEKLIFYYIILKENFIPTDAEFAKVKEEIYNENLESYIDYYADQIAELEGDALDSFMKDLEASVKADYSEMYYRESVQYRFGTEKLLQFAKVQK